MAAPKKLMFNDGYVLDKNSIYLASQIQEYARMIFPAYRYPQ